MVVIWLGMWDVALALDTDVDEDKKPKLKFIFGQHKQAQLLTCLGHLFFFVSNTLGVLFHTVAFRFLGVFVFFYKI